VTEIDTIRRQWDSRHADPELQPKAAEVLRENRHLLPAHGQALDLACGLGGNAILLAEAGLEVSAWDLSSIAIEQLLQSVAQRDLSNLNPEVRDVEKSPPPPNSFDVITVSFFLDRPLIPHLISSLRPGGVIFYQTFSRIAVTDRGPTNPDFRLGENELLGLFSPLSVRFYREEGRLGDTSQGVRDIAMLVAQKPV